jgi:2,3-bisphosphoglycerate-dependent phosphoglycerate mutase
VPAGSRCRRGARVSVEIVFETHSLTIDNERGVATGHLPGELSPAGRHLAAELGERRRDDGLSAVFASDLDRAVETARIAFAETGLPLLVDARLRECDYGLLNGGAVSEVDAVRALHVDEPFPHGESYRQVVGRMRSFLGGLERERDGDRVLLVGHSATRWALDHLLDGEPLEALVAAPFEWREGWEYVLGARAGRSGSHPRAARRRARPRR